MNLLRVCLSAAVLSAAMFNVAHAASAGQETNLAAQSYQAGDYKTAVAHFQQVVKLEPTNTKALLFLGQSLAKLNDNMGARKAFAKVLALQASGPVAERAIEQLSKLPEPDLFTLQLDTGITLGDWMKFAQQQIAAGKRDAVLGEIAQHLRQFGPVPQLLSLQDRLQKEAQAEQEQKLDAAIAAIEVADADSAKAALPQIRKLKQKASQSLELIHLEARACHYLKNFACAQSNYAAYIKAAPANDPKRESMVAALMQAKQHEALVPPKLIEMVAIPGKNYAIGKYEVTQKQWQDIMGSNPSKFTACGENCPVEQVSWNDVQEFIQKLNEETGLQYRLPTEAEWEYACYGEKKTDYCGGNDINAVAWYDKNSNNTTHPVGQKQANGYGLYDMSGNVWEWMQDKWDNEHDWRVLRGGSWFVAPQNARAAFRYRYVPVLRDNFYGFRLAKTLP